MFVLAVSNGSGFQWSQFENGCFEDAGQVGSESELFARFPNLVFEPCTEFVNTLIGK